MPTGSTSRAPRKRSAEREKSLRRKESEADAARKAAAKAQPKESALAARRPLLKESEKLEQQIAGWQNELKLLETRLADPTLYADADGRLLDDLTLRQNLLTQNIEAAESRWLEIHELLDNAQET
jgi:ATP-binding cassette subfamily F protein 3